MASLPPSPRAWLIATAVLGTVLLTGGAAGLVVQAVSRLESDGSARRPAVTVPATAIATAGVETTAARAGGASATADATATAGTASDTAPAVVRSATVAFRRNGAVWVADERGTRVRSVAVSAEGVYSLSPDALTLAVVDVASGQLSLMTVATGAAIAVGPAAQSPPVWSPDSTWLVYRREPNGGGELVRVTREGTQPRVLGVGSSASITPDAGWVYVVRVDVGGIGRIARISSTRGPATPVPQNPTVTGVSEAVAGTTRVFFASQGAAGTPPVIRSMTRTGADVKPLVPGPITAPDVSLTGLRLSPDGAWLAYQESGDDGYSRIQCVRTSGGDPVKLSLRYDAYLIGWSAAGAELLFAEGNTVQGETSRIMAVRPDGSGRRVVAEDAGL